MALIRNIHVTYDGSTDTLVSHPYIAVQKVSAINFSRVRIRNVKAHHYLYDFDLVDISTPELTYDKNPSQNSMLLYYNSSTMCF
jgi:hypothetical protein